MTNKNPHIGGTLEDFLKEDGIAEEVRAVAIKRTVALQTEHEMVLKNARERTVLDISDISGMEE